MLKLMDLDDVTKNLVPVTSTEYFAGKTQSFHPDGLFSEKIFGPVDSPDRKNTYSFIELNTTVFHPALFPVIRRLEQKLLVAMSGEKNYSLNDDGVLVGDENGNISGMTAVIKNFNKIKFRGGTKDREDLIQLIEGYKRKNLVFLDKTLVIPPTYRDITIHDSGEITVQPLNDYYLNILRLSLQLRSIRSGTVYDLLSYKMFNLVKELYDYIISKMAKKTGLLRGNMLGKRVDFSARAVIVGAASELKPNELGIPFKILVKLFEPFILHDILNSGIAPKEEISSELEKYNGSKLSALSLRKLFIGIYKHDEIPERLENLLKESIERAVEGKVVIAKRDPSLHAESVQAFYPRLIEGNAIKICPTKCSAFNADFDGDQMALYVPITRQAIEEAKDKLMVSMSKDGGGEVADSFDKDVAIGTYVLTQNPPKKSRSVVQIKSAEEAFELNIYDSVKFGGINTTAGRVIFNQALPEDMKFINKPIDKKMLSKLADVIHNKYGKEEFSEYTQKVLKLAFKYGTLASPSFSMDDFEIPNDVKELKKQIPGQPPEEVTNILNKAEKRLEEDFTSRGTNIGVIGEAGGLKGWGQTRQILVSKGLTQDNEGKVQDPIAESYVEGFNSKDFFKTGAGTRKGISDRVLNTADTGYLSRQLVYALQRVEADPTRYDCGTKKFFKLKVTKDIAHRLYGRYMLVQGKPKEIKDPDKLIGKVIPLKSPLYCLTPKVCKTCYGKLLERNRTLFVGILAAQIIGERGTQLIMRTFHTGGAVSVNTVNVSEVLSSTYKQSELDTFNKLFTQKGIDIHSNVDGYIEIDKKEFLNPKKDITVKDGQIRLEYGYFTIKNSSYNFPITIDAETIVYYGEGNIEENENKIIVKFNSTSKVFTVSPVTDSFSDKMRDVQHLFSGKKPWRSADHFCMKIFDQYAKDAKSADLIHFEILASNLLRDSRNPSYPARLNKDYSAIIMNIKQIPALESWLSALSFEDPNKSITTGLTYDRDQSESVLEKIVNGSL